MGTSGMIASITTALRRWWQTVRRRNRYSHAVVVSSMLHVPQDPGDAIYLVGEHPRFKWAVLECPCRCGERIAVNLMASVSPSWAASICAGQLTLHPSLWRANETCGSHFLIRANKVVWV